MNRYTTALLLLVALTSTLAKASDSAKTEQQVQNFENEYENINENKIHGKKKDSVESEHKSVQKPNVIVIVVDDVGWNDVSFHGSNQVLTPNIDALAYTGHYVIRAQEPWGLGLEEKLLPQYLKEQGYATHAVGKWHLGFHHKEYTPTYRGFDSYFGFYGSHKDYVDHTMQDNMDVALHGRGEYATRLFTQKAEHVVNEHNTSQPLFLYLAHLGVHVGNLYRPLYAPQETVDQFAHIVDKRRRVFAAMLAEVDHSVGIVVQALASRGMLENSIILLTTDNGGSAGGYRNSAANNWPLRGTKNSLWEGGVRSTGLVWSPMLQNTPRVSMQLAHIQDWLPTLLSAIGANVTLEDLDGIDLWPALNDPQLGTRENLLINIDDIRNIYALRMGDWKIIKGSGPNNSYNDAYGPPGRKGVYNITAVKNSHVAVALESIEYPISSVLMMLQLREEATVNCEEGVEWTCRAPEGETCLFNIKDDPCETKDLAREQPLILQSMLDLLAAYNATAVPPRNQPTDPNSNPVFWNRSWTNWLDYPPPMSSQ
ncbi:hypothetical protein B566_EDAN002700 [Ephemera danica]|nr:hypothetical protein B566_EDAN002700 [Ephemera danica]